MTAMTATDDRTLTTTFGELLEAIDDVAETQEEACAVIEMILEEEKISFLGSAFSAAA